jgi:hypothetical protein
MSVDRIDETLGKADSHVKGMNCEDKKEEEHQEAAANNELLFRLVSSSTSFSHHS